MIKQNYTYPPIEYDDNPRDFDDGLSLKTKSIMLMKDNIMDIKLSNNDIHLFTKYYNWNKYNTNKLENGYITEMV